MIAAAEGEKKPAECIDSMTKKGRQINTRS
jgi:hypothetical protein